MEREREGERETKSTQIYRKERGGVRAGLDGQGVYKYLVFGSASSFFQLRYLQYKSRLAVR